MAVYRLVYRKWTEFQLMANRGELLLMGGQVRLFDFGILVEISLRMSLSRVVSILLFDNEEAKAIDGVAYTGLGSARLGNFVCVAHLS